VIAQRAWGWAPVSVEDNHFTDLSPLRVLDGNGVTGAQTDHNNTTTLDLVPFQ
tara:strand:- start:2533 stop:2691 length:159 start_codon:yes stop_codon:yes gene_type:complete